MLPPSLVRDAVKADSVFVCFAVLSLRRHAQVIPVNANGVPIGEIPFVRSGLLGFVGPVSRTLSLEHFCGNLKPFVSLTLSQYNNPVVASLAPYRAVSSSWWGRSKAC